MLISVIVPVYNVEQYLEQCIESILNQSYTNFELILINDGSTDRSLTICEKYAAHDTRIIVIDKENGGVSSARNAGINIAKGEWITFVDSDDWVAPVYVEELIDENLQNDCWPIQGVIKVREQDRFISYEYDKNNAYTIRNFFKVYKINPYLGTVYCKLFNRRLLDKYNIRFSRELNYGEDTVFNLNYMNFISEIYTKPNANYFYRDTDDSLSKKPIDYQASFLLFAAEEKFLKRFGDKTILDNNIGYALIRYFMSVINSNKLKYSEKIEVVNYLRITYKNILMKNLEKEGRIGRFTHFFVKYNLIHSIVLIFSVRVLFVKIGLR